MPVYALADADLEVEEEGAYWIAPTAVLIGKVVLKRNASVWFGAVLRGDNEPIIVGENSNVQDGSVPHTDMGAPLMLHGCTIGDEALIGIKATVLNHAVIQKHTLVGAHALVTERKTFPERSLVTGAPAAVARELSDIAVQTIQGSALHYVENWKRYARDLTLSRA
jgi:carbonic anhydrase/acetyltransferase-like protein (isoleucine patch superfamily)